MLKVKVLTWYGSIVLNFLFLILAKHYDSCVKGGNKRGREEESEEDRKKRLDGNKKRLMDSFKKTPPKRKPGDSSDDDFLDDVELATETPTFQLDEER